MRKGPCWRTVLLIVNAVLIFGLASYLGYLVWDYYHEPQYEPGTITFDIKTLEPEPLELPQEEEGDEATENTIVYPETKVGWITLDGLDIDDPVMQADDNSYYLTRDEFDNYSVWGCYYMMAENDASAPSALDRVTVVFGHSNGNATHGKFAALKRLRDPTVAAQHPYIHLWIGDTQTVWQIFAVGDFPVTHDYMIPNPDDGYFLDLCKDMVGHSLHYYEDSIVTAEDKVLILSTCSGSNSYETRFLVCAKLVNIDEHRSESAI